MKKVDLHVHTRRTIWDSNSFSFDEEVLKKYVSEKKISIIAITNHNCFDYDQYEHLVEIIPDCTILPGIEVSLGKNCGHMLVVADSKQIVPFTLACSKVEELIVNLDGYLTEKQFREIFDGLKSSLFIPHYQKSPHIAKDIIDSMKDWVFCGEVASIKKFIYCKKNDDGLTPVLFSDFRPSKDTTENDFPIRQTYIDVNTNSFLALKRALKDKTKVGLNNSFAHSMFEALPNLPLSTGLNVILGERSSGKTHTLKELYKRYPDAKFIRQFSLLERDDDKAEQEFVNKIAAKQGDIVEDYLREFYSVVNEVKDISLEKDIAAIDDYINSLIQNAEESERADLFSKCTLFSESNFSLPSTKNIQELISAVEKLLDATEYKELIESVIKREQLISLHQSLIQKYETEQRNLLEKKWVNKVVANIKKALQQKTAITNIVDCDLSEIATHRIRIVAFENVVNQIKKKEVIYSSEMGGFTTEISKRPYEGPAELKAVSRSKTAFSAAFEKYEHPYEYLQALLEIETLDVSTLYKYFVKTEYLLLNAVGYPVSGGERAEYNLIQELSDAKMYDMLLIDEPESSFDNIFLKNRVNQVIKDLALILPVVIVTHNNTVGASIKPDYILYTKRCINSADDVQYKIFSGNPEDRQLKTSEGETISNIKIMLDCLEAGEEAYIERGKDYEMLKD